MDKDIIFLYVIAAVSCCFGLVNCSLLLLKRNRTAKTVGRISSFKTINPENVTFRNSKWARVSYIVNGKNYQSHNRIQVPMAAQIGTSVTVRYDMLHPEILYRFSVLRILVSFLIAVLCILVAVLV